MPVQFQAASSLLLPSTERLTSICTDTQHLKTVGKSLQTSLDMPRARDRTWTLRLVHKGGVIGVDKRNRTVVSGVEVQCTNHYAISTFKNTNLLSQQFSIWLSMFKQQWCCLARTRTRTMSSKNSCAAITPQGNHTITQSYVLGRQQSYQTLCKMLQLS